jgi:hypothetical protein
MTGSVSGCFADPSGCAITIRKPFIEGCLSVAVA